MSPQPTAALGAGQGAGVPVFWQCVLSTRLKHPFDTPGHAGDAAVQPQRCEGELVWERAILAPSLPPVGAAPLTPLFGSGGHSMCGQLQPPQPLQASQALLWPG